MTIKLNKRQLEALHTLIGAALNMIRPQNIADSLVHELVDGINDRIRAKLKKSEYDSRTGYSLKLKSIDAKALHVWYLNIESRINEGNAYHYESLVAREVIHQIDKEYA